MLVNITSELANRITTATNTIEAGKILRHNMRIMGMTIEDIRRTATSFTDLDLIERVYASQYTQPAVH